MSEYIISTTNMPEHVRETLNAWCDVSGEIVRCRDCKFSRIHDGKRYPGKKAKGRMYCINWCDGYEADWTKPDGFCHRAKRKEGE